MTWKRSWFLWALLIVLGFAPVASYAHALGHLNDAHDVHEKQTHAKVACEGAYASLGHALAPSAIPPLGRTNFASGFSAPPTAAAARSFSPYRGRAPPVLPTD